MLYEIADCWVTMYDPHTKEPVISIPISELPEYPENGSFWEIDEWETEILQIAYTMEPVTG